MRCNTRLQCTDNNLRSNKEREPWKQTHISSFHTNSYQPQTGLTKSILRTVTVACLPDNTKSQKYKVTDVLGEFHTDIDDKTRRIKFLIIVFSQSIVGRGPVTKPYILGNVLQLNGHGHHCFKSD
jgi:hypothetical protein